MSLFDNAKALHEFWSSFSWKAYDENTVPSEDLEPIMPRITYAVSWTAFDDPITLSASLWDRSYSWTTVEQKANEIYEAIGGGMSLPNNMGRVWIPIGTPFAQRMGDPDDSVRRIVLQVYVEFFNEV